MGKAFAFFAMIALFAPLSFAAELWEQKCGDGTGYLECSQSKPGYICALSGGALSLQNVIGETYPSDFPVAGKAGQPTANAIKCACENFPGYEERGGQCLKQGEAVEAGQNDTGLDSGGNYSGGGAQMGESAAAAGGGDSAAGGNASKVRAEKAQLLAAPMEKAPAHREGSALDFGALGFAGAALAASVVGGIVIIGLIIAAIALAYRIKRER